MNRSGAQIIQALLVSASLLSAPAAATDWPCYIGQLPDKDQLNVPDEAAAVYDMPGIKEGKQMKNGFVLERSQVQIKTRSLDYTSGWNKLNAICAALDPLAQVRVMVDTAYSYLLPGITRGSPISLGPEQGVKRRFLFVVTVNFAATEL